MPLRVSIHQCLAADEALAALIGAGDSCRHYPERAKQDVPAPYVVSVQITGGARMTHGHLTDPEDRLDETDIDFTCMAATVTEAIAVRAAVRAALLNDENGFIATAKIVVTSPQERMLTADAAGVFAAQLGLTFFHNPQT